MPTKPRRPRSRPRPRPKDTRRSSAARGYDARWREIRAITPQTPCVDCQRPWAEGFHLDHIDGQVMNRSQENLAWRCPPCHSSKTVRRDGGFGREPTETYRYWAGKTDAHWEAE